MDSAAAGEKPAVGADNVNNMKTILESIQSVDECGMGEGGMSMDMPSEPEDPEMEDWDNSPEEEYSDTKTMTKDLSGGINREKKAYAKAQDGDNAMAVETSIKEQLWAALNDKLAEGNKDIKTTEGSRGKKSRGKKSRG